jgi:leucyl-tRNA synthetase
MLAPMAPHVAAEMWSNLLSCTNIIQRIESDSSLLIGSEGTHAKLSDWIGDSACDDVLRQRWPIADESLRRKDEIVVAVQVNGKMRGTITVPSEFKDDVATLERLAKDSPIGQKFLAGKTVKKVIVPTKVVQPIVSFVVG